MVAQPKLFKQLAITVSLVALAAGVAFGIFKHTTNVTMVDFAALKTDQDVYASIAKTCNLREETEPKILSGHRIILDRYQCDKNTLKRFPETIRKSVLDELANDGTEDVENISLGAIIFFEKSWLLNRRKAIYAHFTPDIDMSTEFGITNGQPAVLVTSAEIGAGNSSGLDWQLVTALTSKSIGPAKMPFDDLMAIDRANQGVEHLNTVRLHKGEFLSPGTPNFRNGILTVESPIAEPDDPHCCTSGGILQSQYTLENGSLKISATRRLSQSEAEKLQRQDASSNSQATRDKSQITERKSNTTQVHLIAEAGFWYATEKTLANNYTNQEMSIAISDNGMPYAEKPDGSIVPLTSESWRNTFSGHFLIVEATHDTAWRMAVRQTPSDISVQITSSLCKERIPVRTFAQEYNTDEAVTYSSACEPILGKQASFNDLFSN